MSQQMTFNNYKIFSWDEDYNLDELGKIIGTKPARKFLKITQNNELNLKEIAKRIVNDNNPRLAAPSHHKNRLKELGLIVSTSKLHRRNGPTLNFYNGKKIVIIAPEEMREKLAKVMDELVKQK